MDLSTSAVTAYELLRVKHWFKNAFVLVPLVFSGLYTSLPHIWISILAFVAFSLTASAIYILNDIRDAPYDRLHPIKSNRPIARGAVPVPVALAVGVLCFSAGIVPGLVSNIVPVLGVYVVLMSAYTFVLKHVPFLDMFVIVVGLVLRVLAGVAALSVAPSVWILTATASIGLFLLSAKRLMEQLRTQHASESRPVQRWYNMAVLSGIMHFSAGAALVVLAAYVLVGVQNVWLLPTLAPAAIGLARMRSHVYRTSPTTNDNPIDIILADRVILFAVLAFGLLSLAGLQLSTLYA